MKQEKLHQIVEYGIVILFFGIMLNAGCGVLFDHTIVHGYPYGLLASDAFQHQVRAEGLKELGNYRNEAFYVAHGYTDVIGNYMPVFYHLGVILSNSAGFESWDGTFFLVFFSSCLAALIMYVIIRRYNRYVAILSLPLSILVFSQVPYIGYTWGQWPNIMGLFYLTAFFWAFSQQGLKYSYILLGILLAAVAMTHTTMFIFAVFYIICVFLYRFFFAKVTLTQIKGTIYAFILLVLISWYYLNIFYQTWLQRFPYKFEVTTEWPGGTGSFNFIDFGVLLPIIIIGIVISFFILRKKENHAILLGLFTLIFGYSNYVGFRHRAFTLRILWPVFLSIFLGLGCYYLLKIVIKKNRLVYSAILSILLLILINSTLLSGYIPHPAKFSSTGLMNEYHWDGIAWIRDNTRQDANVLFFYGDPYIQNSVLRNAKRHHYLVMLGSKDGAVGLTEAIENGIVRRYYRIRIPGDSGAGLPYKKSFLTFGFHTEEDPLEKWAYASRDLCGFEYYVFDKYTRQPIFAQYNQMVVNELMKSGLFEIAYENEIQLILKNNEVGGDCVG